VKKNPKVFLEHIQESILLIEEYATGLSKADFLKKRFLQDAIIRRLEIIGEAVKNLPMSFRSKHTHIPWKQIAGMRDILIHEYFEVDLALTWQVIKKELPPLRSI
jgi:uncharacterized protein with HEPN domain